VVQDEKGMVTDRTIGNQVIGMQIRESEEDMRIEFELREKVVAYLKERGENNFVYHLRDVESQIVAPVIRDNRWIRELKLTSTPRGVDVNFETAADILVETRQSMVEGEPMWVISLRKSVAEVAPAEVSSITRTVEPVMQTSTAVSVAPNPEEVISTEEPGGAETAVAVATPPNSFNTPAEDEVRIQIRTTNPAAKSGNQLAYAVELMNSRRLADAEALLQSLLTGVEDHNARQHLLALYSRQNRSDRFLRLVRESVAAYPDDALFRTEYARSLFQAQSYREVIQLLTQGAPANASQLALVAASYQRLDEHENAVRHYQQALKLDSTNARNWIGLGISQEHSATLEDALHSYRQAGKLGNLNQRLQAFVEKRTATLGQVLN
jgi:hypothetical protein